MPELCPTELGLDEACLKIQSFLPHDVYVWHQFQECFTCDATLWATLPANSTISLLLSSAYPTYFYYTNDKGVHYCRTQGNFEEHGVYGWNITNGSCSDVKKIQGPSTHFYLRKFGKEFKEPSDASNTLVIALVILGLCSVLSCVVRCIYRQGWTPRVWLLNVTFSELENDLGSPQGGEPSSSPSESRAGSTWRQVTTRLQSLDTFRGICIAMMIFVNYGGGKYRFFHHTPWNGMTIADVIFPWFLWVMGMSLNLSLRSQLRNDRSRWSVWLSVLRRSVILIFLGLLLNSFGHHNNDLSNFRLGGVLQRIGASFLIVASIETIFMKLQCSSQYGLLLDFVDGWAQWLCALALAGLWLVITFFLDVPGGCGRGYLGPGGMHQHGNFSNCTGGAAGFLDRLIFHPQHMYQHPTCQKIYQSTVPYDPEGLLGTLTAAFLVHLGVNASRVMLYYDYEVSRISRWIFWGVICALIGGMLCGFSKETGHIPINKNLFSLSFVLVTGGLAYFVVVILYIVIDYKGWWSGAPFHFAGTNSILIYVGHEIARDMIPFSWKPIFGTHAEFLGMNLLGTSLWLIIAYLLHMKHFFVRI